MEGRLDPQSLSSKAGSDTATPEAVIVSAYGRGDWLAGELADRGWSVELIDVTESLGATVSPEDAEGPFGWFEAPDLLPSQSPRAVEITADEDYVAAPHGFTLWLKEGPLEFSGALSDFHAKSHKMPAVVAAYLKKSPLVSRESERDLRLASKLSFKENWLAHFIHQVASPVLRESYRAIGDALPLAVAAPFFVRQASVAGWQRSLQRCQDKGVRVLAKTRIQDVRLGTNGLVDTLEISDARSSVQHGKAFVWTLSSAETDLCPPQVASKLFPKGVIHASWYWSRFAVEFAGGENSNRAERQLPIHNVIIDDAFLPWSHTNVMILKRLKRGAAPTARSEVWVKLPIRASRDRDYRAQLAQQLQAVLQKRMPTFEPKIILNEACLAQDLDVVRFPIYTPEDLAKLKRLKTKNIWFCGPELWSTLDVLGRFRNQNLILAGLIKLKDQWTQAALRAARQAASRNNRAKSSISSNETQRSL